ATFFLSFGIILSLLLRLFDVVMLMVGPITVFMVSVPCTKKGIVDFIQQYLFALKLK
ncbi:MAG: hypothetical protein ACI9Q9_001255, partial [Flavobacterium sp.]